jgi:hypothetical protein
VERGRFEPAPSRYRGSIVEDQDVHLAGRVVKSRIKQGQQGFHG